MARTHFPQGFASAIVSGAGRGKSLGSPTFNLDLSYIPPELREGIYVCRTSLDNGPFLDAVMHYGPRPVFREGIACEVHILDSSLTEQPKIITVHVMNRLRDVRDFPSPEALREQIQHDIEDARAILESSA